MRARKAADNDSCEAPQQEHAGIGGAAGKGGRQRSLQVDVVQSVTGLYMEKQLRKFCQIHALNALLGKTAIQPTDILNFCSSHAERDSSLGAALEGEGMWTPHEGNFADVTINAFLHYHTTPTVRLYSVANRVPIGSTADCFLSGLPADQDAFMLSWHQGTQLYEDVRYGHAVCVRKHPRTQQWYLLDSERDWTQPSTTDSP